MKDALIQVVFFSVGESWIIEIDPTTCWYFECLDENQWSDMRIVPNH